MFNFLLLIILLSMSINTIDQINLDHLRAVEVLQSKIQEQAKLDFEITQLHPFKEQGWCIKKKFFRYEPKHKLCSFRIYKDAIQHFGSDSTTWKSFVKEENEKCWIESIKTTSCINF